VESTHAGAVREELQPVERNHVGEVCGGLSPVRGTFTLEEGQSVRSPPLEGQRAADTACDELTAAPIPCPSAPLGGVQGTETGEKLSPGEGRGEGKVF